MKRKILISAICLIGIGSYSPFALSGDTGLDKCLKAASKIKSGDFVKLEYLSFQGKPTYELELKDAQGMEWEFMCNASDGKIFEQEREAESESDPMFAKHKKVSLKTAKETVLAKYPGTIVEVEFEIEENGDPSYEIDVVNDNGKEFKVEVDARTGKIIEESEEMWEIGQEADEMVPR